MTEEKKGWGNTVLGWFVVREEDAALDALNAGGPPVIGDSLVDAADARSRGLPLPPPPVTPRAKAPAAPVRSATSSPSKGGAAQPLAPVAPPLPVFSKEPPPATKGDVDFAKVFEAADIDAEEQSRVTRSVDLMKSLPEGTEPAVKKQIVEVSLKAFGVPIDKIIEAGVAEIQALEGYLRAVAARTQKSVTDSEERIAKLEQTIKDLREESQQLVGEQQTVLKSCNDKKLEVQHILEFFGQEAVAKVVQDSPKLHDPTTMKS
jgi:cell division protein FtsB